MKDQIYSFNNKIFNASKNEVDIDGQIVVLDPRDATLLKLFCDNVDKTMSRYEIIEQAFPNSDIQASAITQYVSELRKLLKPFDELKTINRKGYRFSADVQVSSIAKPHVKAAASNTESMTLFQASFKWIALGCIILLAASLGVRDSRFNKQLDSSPNQIQILNNASNIFEQGLSELLARSIESEGWVVYRSQDQMPRGKIIKIVFDKIDQKESIAVKIFDGRSKFVYRKFAISIQQNSLAKDINRVYYNIYKALDFVPSSNTFSNSEMANFIGFQGLTLIPLKNPDKNESQKLLSYYDHLAENSNMGSSFNTSLKYLARNILVAASNHKLDFESSVEFTPSVNSHREPEYETLANAVYLAKSNSFRAAKKELHTIPVSHRGGLYYLTSAKVHEGLGQLTTANAQYHEFLCRTPFENKKSLVRNFIFYTPLKSTYVCSRGVQRIVHP